MINKKCEIILEYYIKSSKNDITSINYYIKDNIIYYKNEPFILIINDISYRKYIINKEQINPTIFKKYYIYNNYIRFVNNKNNIITITNINTTIYSFNKNLCIVKIYNYKLNNIKRLFYYNYKSCIKYSINEYLYIKYNYYIYIKYNCIINTNTKYMLINKVLYNYFLFYNGLNNYILL